jgi:copper resistance protein B
MNKRIATTKLPAILLSSTLLLVTGGLAAQTATEAQPHQHDAQDHSKMGHSKMDHSKMQHDDMQMDHSQMDHSKMQHDDMQMDHSQMDHSQMQHDDMQMDHSKMQHDDMQMDHSQMDHSKMQHDDMQMDHSQMDHSKMQHDDMQMDHSQMDHSQMDHSKMQHDDMQMDHSSMDHGDMQMQGGKAPADARDPHAYSSGYTLTDGPYGMADSRHLKHAVEHPMWSVMADRLEYDIDSDAVVFDMQAWYGTTYDKLVVKTEGHISEGKLEESQTDLLWGHAVAAYWDTLLGVRFDQYAHGDNRQWLALGVQGLAPYWFELDITAYVGSNGRTALAAEAEYELLLTQRLVLQGRAELTAYGKDDAVNAIGKGLASLSAGLRLRYEFSRQFAPYAGIEWSSKYGNTADLARLHNETTEDTAVVAGIRFWF